MDDFEDLVGLTVEAAEENLSTKGFVLRVTEEDGRSGAITMDIRDDRLNVAVVDGKISQIFGIG
jgi:hypothetical protein